MKVLIRKWIVHDFQTAIHHPAAQYCDHVHESWRTNEGLLCYSFKQHVVLLVPWIFLYRPPIRCPSEKIRYTNPPRSAENHVNDTARHGYLNLFHLWMQRNEPTPTDTLSADPNAPLNSPKIPMSSFESTMRQRYTQSSDMPLREHDDSGSILIMKAAFPSHLNSPQRTHQKSHSTSTNTIVEMDTHLVNKECRRKLIVLGVDLTHQAPKFQFIFIATCFFACSLLYGYLQELISVKLANRQLALFLASLQFLGYSIWSYVLFSHQYQQQMKNKILNMDAEIDVAPPQRWKKNMFRNSFNGSMIYHSKIPIRIYLYLSILRAVDLSMTNLAMGYLNYPAKTLMKSSRVAFTMLFAAIFWGKRYRLYDFVIVVFMVLGLGLFLHADSTTSVVFNPIGIVMLTISLLCDGAVINISERLMNRYDVGQDEFIFRSYSIACLAIAIAAALEGDLSKGFRFLTVPGTWDEVERSLNYNRLESNILDGNMSSPSTWNVVNKICVITLFSTMGFLSSSCSSAITKEFGALTTSITSTARKATTLFLSFALFGNVCTFEHIMGIILFICGLIAKSLRASSHNMDHARRYISLKESSNDFHSNSSNSLTTNDVDIV